MVVGVVVPGTAFAQGLLSPGQKPKVAQQQDQSGTDAKKFQQSLDEVIETLEDDAKRRALLQQLKSLQQGAQAAEAANDGGRQDQSSLLETLTDSLRDAGGAEALSTVWTQRTERALSTGRDLVGEAGRARTIRNLAQSALGLGVWLAGLVLLTLAGRRLYQRVGWPVTLPKHPRATMLTAHFLRRVMPWGVTFLGMFWSMQILSAPVPVQAMVLSVAYVGLCGQAFSCVVEVVIALFADGHRRVAAGILQRRALKPLFVVGALIALGDAADGERLRELLHQDLAQWVSVVANLLAAVVAAWLVVRMRRPVAHLIRNRDYAQRCNRSLPSELLGLFARIWHIPALLAIGSSMAAVLVAGGGADTALARAVVCAVLLLVMLIGNGLLIRHRNRLAGRRYGSEYRQRLLRFGYALAGFVAWALFAEIVLWIWGFSLLGLGTQTGISPVVGRALLGLGVTALLAWLIWIFADIAIARAMRGTTRHPGKTSTRAQTVTPMLRNVVFFTIVVIAGIAGLANLGVNVTPLLAGAGVIGLAVGFGAQTLVQDLITGLFILIEDSMAVGDFVQIGNYMGTVEGLNLRTVRLRDLDGVVHYITFSHIDSIHNMSRGFGTALLKIRVPHDLPIDDAVTLMQETAMELRKDPWIGSLIRSPLEMQGIHSFEEGCPILRMRMRTTPEYQWDVGRAFNLLLKQRMERQDVTLGAPRLTVSMSGEGGREYGGSSRATVDRGGPQPDGV